MVRVTNAGASRRRKKRLFKLAKGFRGDRKNHLRLTSTAVLHALAFNYAHRKQNKRNFRSLWVQRINAAARIHGISYSRLMYGLKLAQCALNRKVLADMDICDPASFAGVVSQAKGVLV